MYAPSSPTTNTIDLQGTPCALHTWEASSSPHDNQPPTPRGVCVIYHGFLAHGRYPTVRYAAELLASNGFIVVAADLPGHGASPGMRGYLDGADHLIRCGLAVAEHGAALCRRSGTSGNPLPLFLVGSSMGGTIALAVALELSKKQKKKGKNDSSGDDSLLPEVAGVVLLAPMLALDVATPLRHVLYGIACIPMVSTALLIPSSSTSAEKQYRDGAKRKECEDDPLAVNTGGKIRPASASTCVELANGVVAERLHEVSVPFLCLVAKEDVVVDNSGSYRLMEQAASKDKTLKSYDALHGLLCEPKPLIDEIHRDILDWLEERC